MRELASAGVRRSLSARAVLAAAVASLLCGAAARAAEPAAPDALRTRSVLVSGPLKLGDKAPSFAGWTATGALLTLDQMLREKPGAVVVSFFATWCKPCKENLPAISRVAETLREKGVRVVLVAYGENADVVKPWLDANGIALPVILDPFTKIAQRMGVDKGLPRTVVLDGRGLVRTIFEVEGSDFEQALRLAVLAALQSPDASDKVVGKVE